MTDITELAQRMKAAAVRAKAATEDYVLNRMSITVCLEECKEFNDLSDGPDNILALVEALEKAQAKATQQGNIALALFDEVTQLRRHADEKAPELRAQLIEADSELEALRQRIAELESRTVKLPPLNDDLIAILGRPNFMCAHLAELLRKSGKDINRKAEHEQAAIIHWFLSIYLEHGEKWEGVAKSDIQARVAGIKWEAE